VCAGRLDVRGYAYMGRAMILTQEDYDRMIDTLTRAKVKAEDALAVAKFGAARQQAAVIENSVYQALIRVRALAEIAGK
jgi:hypothetical protein